MRIAHVLPHALVGPDGHLTRHLALKTGIPELEPVWTLEQLAGKGWNWDVLLFDEPPDWHRDALWWDGARRHPETKTVRIFRTYEQRPKWSPGGFDLEVSTGPYEGGEATNAPIVQLTPQVKTDIPLLLVPSRGQSSTWWLEIPKRVPCVVAESPAPPWVARAGVVICAGGAAGMYEALWSGARCVCLPQNGEQRIRAENAQRAGEAIVLVYDISQLVKALSTVALLAPLGRRTPGTEAVVRSVRSLVQAA